MKFIKLVKNGCFGLLSDIATMVVMVTLLLLVLFGASPSSANHEHFNSYLDHRDFYMTHFNEMLGRKNEMYQSKHHEYSDRLNTYDNINHEDQRHHEEADDEQMEANHENHEIDHESSHHHAKRTGIVLNHRQKHQHKMLLLKRRELKDVIRSTKKKAIQFIRKQNLPKRLRL